MSDPDHSLGDCIATHAAIMRGKDAREARSTITRELPQIGEAPGRRVGVDHESIAAAAA